MQTLSIIIPVYNERRTIREIIANVRASDTASMAKEIVVVDDGSTDGSRDVLRSLPADPSLKVIFQERNTGKGGALKRGFAEAAGDYLLIQDADLEYDPADYPLLIEPVRSGRADVVFGSRNLRPNNVPFSAVYFYGGRLTTRLFNMLFGTSFTDIHTCYKLFPARFVPPLLYLPSDDFVFDAVELTRALARLGRVVEVPIRYRARRRAEGKKLDWRQGVRCVLAMLRIRLGLVRPGAFL